MKLKINIFFKEVSKQWIFRLLKFCCKLKSYTNFACYTSHTFVVLVDPPLFTLIENVQV